MNILVIVQIDDRENGREVEIREERTLARQPDAAMEAAYAAARAAIEAMKR